LLCSLKHAHRNFHPKENPLCGLLSLRDGQDLEWSNNHPELKAVFKWSEQRPAYVYPQLEGTLILAVQHEYLLEGLKHRQRSTFVCTLPKIFGRTAWYNRGVKEF